MQRNDAFQRLVENALDFFEHSTTEFSDQPKYSLISFCAGVELFVKAQLLLEHWALIMKRPEDAVWEKFRAGDFESVGLFEAQRRLKRIAGHGLTDAEFAAFSRLTEHRNQLVHFHHEAQQDKAAFATQVASEQLVAWIHLHRLLTRRWALSFCNYRERLLSIEREMLSRREYLTAKHQALKSEIEEDVNRGVIYEVCPACGFQSVKELISEGRMLDELVGKLTRQNCLVCRWHVHQLEFYCPECRAPVLFQGESQGDCKGCGKHLGPGDLLSLCSDSELAEFMLVKDGDDSYCPSGCSDCQTTDTCVSIFGPPICLRCLRLG